jgi:acyl carrier protein
MKKEVLEVLNGLRPDIDHEELTDYIEEGLLDSLDIIYLVAELEKKLGISINGEEILAENFRNLKSIQKLITKIQDL